MPWNTELLYENPQNSRCCCAGWPAAVAATPHWLCKNNYSSIVVHILTSTQLEEQHFHAHLNTAVVHHNTKVISVLSQLQS